MHFLVSGYSLVLISELRNVLPKFRYMRAVESEFFPETSIQHHMFQKRPRLGIGWCTGIKSSSAISYKKRTPLCKHIAFQHALQRDFALLQGQVACLANTARVDLLTPQSLPLRNVQKAKSVSACFCNFNTSRSVPVVANALRHLIVPNKTGSRSCQ